VHRALRNFNNSIAKLHGFVLEEDVAPYGVIKVPHNTFNQFVHNSLLGVSAAAGRDGGSLSSERRQPCDGLAGIELLGEQVFVFEVDVEVPSTSVIRRTRSSESTNPEPSRLISVPRSSLGTVRSATSRASTRQAVEGWAVIDTSGAAPPSRRAVGVHES
jgi:hypothetical protein